VITLGATDELSILRAYQAGSDHHLPANSSYLILRAVIDTITRRTAEHVTSRHIHVEALHIDTAARTADVNGTPIDLGRKEFEILTTLASDPTKVFSKDELARRIWGHKTPLDSSRTVESHIARLRRRLHEAGAHLIHNRRGAGWALQHPA
jgi:DNA-binding response OmpR family regulator